MSPTLQVAAFTLPAVAVAAIASGFASWRPPGPKLTSAIQHLAAGIVFAAAALELLPKEREGAAVPVALGFAIGLALMLGLREFADRIEPRGSESALPVGLILITGIDLVVDGVVLGIAFAAGEQTGVLLSVALTLEVLFLSLAVSVAMSRAGASKALTLVTPAALAALLAVAAMLSRYFLGGLSPFGFTLLLGAGTVALLYLVVEELLVEAHEVKETHWATAAFFVGFLAFLLVEMAVEG